LSPSESMYTKKPFLQTQFRVKAPAELLQTLLPVGHQHEGAMGLRTVATGQPRMQSHSMHSRRDGDLHFRLALI